MLLYWTNNLNKRGRVITMLLSAVGISIAANTIRNALLAWFHGTDQRGMFVWLHDSWGGDLYSALMLLGIVGLFQMLERFEARMKPELSREGNQEGDE
jgi:cyanoexosortase B